MSDKKPKETINMDSELDESQSQLQKNLLNHNEETTLNQAGVPLRMTRRELREMKEMEHINAFRAKKNPLQESNFFQAIFFIWVSPFVTVGQMRDFQQEFHPNIPIRDTVVKNEALVADSYEAKSSIWASIWKLYKGCLIKNLLLIGICQGFTCSIALQMLGMLNSIGNYDDGYLSN